MEGSRQNNFSGYYLEVCQTSLANRYMAIDSELEKALPASDILGSETAVFGLFKRQSGRLERSLIKTERRLASKPQIVGRSVLMLADYLYQMPTYLEERDVFKDWQLSSELMFESAYDEKSLRFLGGLCVYQHEPRTPLKTAIIYPDSFSECVFDERERIALDGSNFGSNLQDMTRLERDLLVGKRQAVAKVCANAVLCGLMDIEVNNGSVNQEFLKN